MKTLRRFTSGIIASIDWIAGQVENHEALIGSVIADLENATSRARVQYNRVCVDGQRLREQIANLHAQIELWGERSIKSAELDRQKAIDCLKRRKVYQQKLSELEVQERSHVAMEKQLAKDLESLTERLSELKQRRTVLKSRELRAASLTRATSDDRIIFEDIENIFDRWESTIGQQELHALQPVIKTDLLEQEFSTVEEALALEAELNELLQA